MGGADGEVHEMLDRGLELVSNSDELVVLGEVESDLGGFNSGDLMENIFRIIPEQ